jgi:hypothetical protein
MYMSEDGPLAIYNIVTCLLNYLDLISSFFQQLMRSASFKKTSREKPGTFQERTVQIRQTCRTIGRNKFNFRFQTLLENYKKVIYKNNALAGNPYPYQAISSHRHHIMPVLK